MGRQTTAKPPKARSTGATARRSPEPALLSGGNPQIAKAEGDAPVQAYIAAMPGWKQEVGRRLDALIERAIPGVRKAVNASLDGNTRRAIDIRQGEAIDAGALKSLVRFAVALNAEKPRHRPRS